MTLKEADIVFTMLLVVDVWNAVICNLIRDFYIEIISL